MELGPEDVSLLERCPHFRGWYVQASMELGPEDVSLLERCPHFRGWCVQASMELGPEDVPLLGRGWYVRASMELGPRRCAPIREVSSFQRVVCTVLTCTIVCLNIKYIRLITDYVQGKSTTYTHSFRHHTYRIKVSLQKIADYK